MKGAGELMCEELQRLSFEVDRVESICGDGRLKTHFIKFLDALTKYLDETNQSLEDLREIVKVKRKNEKD